MNPLPPQAYTKETLTRAFSWLHGQNDSIKELATTPDILVSLYLKAKMNGEGALERPSIQNFKAELKNLAGLMGEFESKYEPVLTPPMPPPAPTAAAPKAAPSANAKAAPSPQEVHDWTQDLDYRSLAMIREMKNEFNLSSDSEALRLLISVGFKKLKSI